MLLLLATLSHKLQAADGNDADYDADDEEACFMTDTVVVMFSFNENPKRCIRVHIAGSQLLQPFC